MTTSTAFLTVAENVSLQRYNTFAVAAKARYWLVVKNTEVIPQAIAFAQARQLPVMVLGGGSNVVLAGDFPGLVLKMALCGIQCREDDSEVVLDIAAGENWHALVEYCLAQGYYGLENLALIPGTVGAAPMQNIGAYGVELESCLEQVSGWDIAEQSWRTLSREDCQLGYRDSIFKHELRDRFMITSVRLRLSRRPHPQIHYAALSALLQQQGIAQPTPRQVADAVIAIRRSKLPDPDAIPNAGSFFKNPVVSAPQHAALLIQYPNLVSFPQPDGTYKLAAGWLLETAGWKGVQRERVGIHQNQSLVLVNHGGSGEDILQLAHAVQQDIQQRFGVVLEIEPRVY